MLAAHLAAPLSWVAADGAEPDSSTSARDLLLPEALRAHTAATRAITRREVRTVRSARLDALKRNMRATVRAPPVLQLPPP